MPHEISILFLLPLKITDCNWLSAKANPPIQVTVDGIVTVFRLFSKKASYPIFSKPSGNITDVIPIGLKLQSTFLI